MTGDDGVPLLEGAFGEEQVGNAVEAGSGLDGGMHFDLIVQI